MALGLVSSVQGAVREVRAVGELRVLVLLAAFPDRAMGRGREHFVGGPGALVDRFVAYYAEVSAGRLRIVPYVAERVVTVPGARGTYVHQPAALASDALVAFASEVRSEAERAALRDAHAVVVFFAGAGRESHIAGGDPNDPWSNYTVIAPALELPDAAPVGEACVIAEEENPPLSSFGVLCHEFGHLLGLPELYAPGGLAHEGIGVWGLMGQGTWLGRGNQPPHPEAWSKARLGWVDVETIATTRVGVTLPAVTAEPRVVKIPAASDRPHEYYLLENRTRTGADGRIPGEGLLVWHVDDSVEGFRDAQVEPAHKLLHLVEADGRGDLDRGHAAGGNRGDASDPWHGPPRWHGRIGAGLGLAGALLVASAVLRAARARPAVPVAIRLGMALATLAAAVWLRRGPVCGPATPGMAPYGGGPARVVIRRISPPGPGMRFDVLIAPAASGG